MVMWALDRFKRYGRWSGVFYFVKDATFYHDLNIVYFNDQIMKKLKNFVFIFYSNKNTFKFNNKNN